MISLIKAQLITLLNLNDLRNRKKRLKALALFGFIALSLSPTYIGYVVYINKAYTFAGSVQLPPDMILSGFYSMTQLAVLLLGLPVVLSTLMRSKDMSILLPLPYTPVQIIAAKMTTAYLSELALTALFILPVFIVNAVHMHPGIAELLNGILCILLLPIIPLVVCAILTVLVVNIPGIGRNKWFYHLATLACLMTVIFSMTSFQMTNGPQSMDLMRLKMQQSSQIAKMIPGSIFGAKALMSTGIEAMKNQAINVGVVSLYIALLFLAAGRMYIGPILRGDYVKRHKSRRAEQITARGFTRSYVRKEFTEVFKDPALLMNGIGGYVAIPFILISYTIMKIQTKGQVDIIGMMLKAANDTQVREFMPILVVAVAFVLAFVGVGSTLFSTSYSKDGKRLWMEKTLPVDPFTIFKSKLLFAWLVVTVLNTIMTLMATWILRLGLLQALYVLVLSEIIILASGTIGMLVDCRRPKTEWKNSTQAVKQNMNALIAFAGAMLLLLINIFLLVGLHRWDASAPGIYLIILAANCVMLAAMLLPARRLSQSLQDVLV